MIGASKDRSTSLLCYVSDRECYRLLKNVIAFLYSPKTTKRSHIQSRSILLRPCRTTTMLCQGHSYERNQSIRDDDINKSNQNISDRDTDFMPKPWATLFCPVPPDCAVLPCRQTHGGTQLGVLLGAAGTPVWHPSALLGRPGAVLAAIPSEWRWFCSLI